MAAIDQQGASTAQRREQGQQAAAHRVVIVGGGVGGLGLATRLSETLGRAGLAQIVLVDRWPTHFWKPLLHEAASGQLDRPRINCNTPCRRNGTASNSNRANSPRSIARTGTSH